MEKLVLTVEELAEALGIGRSTAYAAVRAGDIPSIRVGRRLLVPRVALERLLGEAGSEDDMSDPLRARQDNGFPKSTPVKSEIGEQE